MLMNTQKKSATELLILICKAYLIELGDGKEEDAKPYVIFNRYHM